MISISMDQVRVLPITQPPITPPPSTPNTPPHPLIGITSPPKNALFASSQSMLSIAQSTHWKAAS